MERKERLQTAYEYLRNQGRVHTQKDVASTMEATRQNVSAALKGKDGVLTDNFLRRFNLAFGEPFNLDWLLTGEGEMLKKEGEAAAKPAAPDYRLVPIIHIDSVGGMHSENSILSPEYIEGHIPMTGARSDDVAIYQSGDSMSPAIPSGALLLLREVEDWYEYIGYGNVFVLLLNDGRRITKEVQRYREDPENYYWCVSYNPNVADEELPKRMIRRVWKVIKVLVDNGW